jgi:hypothetical protein
VVSTREQWPLTLDEMCAMQHAARGELAGSDHEKLEQWTARLGGSSATDRARARAAEIIRDAASDGSLDLLAAHLERRHLLDGAEVARILQPRSEDDDAA